MTTSHVHTKVDHQKAAQKSRTEKAEAEHKETTQKDREIWNWKNVERKALQNIIDTPEKKKLRQG
jgi:hypothetical protein